MILQFGNLPSFIIANFISKSQELIAKDIYKEIGNMSPFNILHKRRLEKFRKFS